MRSKKIPAKFYAAFGEFIVAYNSTDNMLKNFLMYLIDSEDIATLLVSNQSFEMIRKRVDAVFKHLIEDEILLKRWSELNKEIVSLTEIRSDIAHAIIDFDHETKQQFVMIRYSEKSVLNFKVKTNYYTFNDLKTYIKRINILNSKLRYLLHSAVKDQLGYIYIPDRKLLF